MPSVAPTDNTRVKQDNDRTQTPRIPNEHDQSADSQSSMEPTGKQVGKLAHQDVQQGKQDTDRAPVTDAVYKKLKQ